MSEIEKGLRTSFKRDKRSMKMKIMTCEEQHWPMDTPVALSPGGGGAERGWGPSGVREEVFWAHTPL